MYLLPSKIHDFEGFIAEIAKQKNLFSEQDIGKTTIKIDANGTTTSFEVVVTE